MALAKVDLLGAQGGGGTGSHVTASFTPSNNSLLCVFVALEEDSGTTDPSADATISDSAGLTWTKQVNNGSGPAWSIGAAIFTAPVTTGVSMTVTLDCGARNIYIYEYGIVCFTGYLGVGVTGSKTTIASDGADSVTLSGSPASTSYIFGGLVQDPSGSGGAIPAAGHTELYQLDGFGQAMQCQVRDPGSTSTAFAWSDVAQVGTNIKATGVAIEITEASSGPDPDVPLLNPSRLRQHSIYRR